MTTVSNDIEAVQLQKEYLELYSAVGVGNAELVEALLTKGLDVNQDYAEILGTIGSNTSRFLLFEAVLHEQKEVVDTLLRHGSKVDIQDNDGVTPLMQAVYANALTILFLLLSHGADILAEDNMGRGALHLAASLNRPQIIEGIVHHKRHHLPSLVDHVSTTGETPLVVAVKAGHFASCDTLIQHGADPNKPDKIGRFPLHYAAELQNERLVKYLLRNLAFPFKYDQQGILPVAMTTNPSLISLFEDCSSYYTTDFRLYEEFASCSGISRLLHYQFVHLFHFYEAYRRNQESSTFTFDLAAATIAEDWDSVEKVVLGKAKDYVLINGDHRVRDRQKSVLSGSFFSYDAVEFYKQVDLVLNGINARLQYLAKDCLKGDHVLSELYACAEIRRKLQSFKVPPTTSFGPNESPKIGNTVGSSSSIINPIVPIASRKPIHQGRTEVGTSSDGLRDPKIQKAETPNFPSGVKLAESRNGRSMVNSNDDDHSDDEVAKNLLQLKAPSAAYETPALAISLSLSKLEEKNRLDNISTATVASTPTIDPFDSEVEVSAVAYRKSSSRDTDVIDTNDSNSAPNQLTGKKRRRSQLPDQSDQQLVQEEISPTFREESKDKTQKKKGIKASNIPLALRSVDSKTSRRTRTT